MPPPLSRRRSGRALPLALSAVLGGALAAGLHLMTQAVEADLQRPRDLREAEYVTSAQCRRCHPGAFESWSHTFHRRMTQEASEGAVLGDFDGSTFTYGGVEAHMSRTDDGGFQMAFRGPEGLMSRARIVRTVGSRRYQQYLAQDGDVLFRLPMAWHVEEGRWFHMNGAFLTPDPAEPRPGERVTRADYFRHVVRWNDNCVFCHNVAPNPGWNEATERWETEVGELGIACEACHGPAGEHARANANPLRRYALHLSEERPDPTIVNPARLPSERSAEICGRCHGQRITDDVGRFLRDGDPFVPGERLADYSRPLARDTPLRGDATAFAARFWRDGTPRLTAYEYQGLLQSPCEGMSCTSCHGMHEGDPRGQLRPAAEGDGACTGCHRELSAAEAARDHARHDAVACVDCHMPRIVYGLIGAHRSHRIEVPDPSSSERPEACSLCHADETAAWTRRGYHRLFGAPSNAPAARRAPVRGEPETLPRVVRDAFGGDPVERAVALAALGRADAAPAGGGLGRRRLAQRRLARRRLARRRGVLLDVMARDAYPGVRRIAWRSLRHLTPDAPLRWLDYTPTAGAADRARFVSYAIRILGERAELPSSAQIEPLRARAATVAIDIGE